MSLSKTVAAVSLGAAVALGSMAGSAVASPARTTQKACNQADKTEHAWHKKHPKATNAQLLAHLKPVANHCTLKQLAVYSYGKGNLTASQVTTLNEAHLLILLKYPNSPLAKSSLISPVLPKPKLPAPTTTTPVATPTVGGPAVPVSGDGDSYNVSISQYVPEPASYVPEYDGDLPMPAENGDHYEAVCLTVTNTGTHAEKGETFLLSGVTTNGSNDADADSTMDLPNCPAMSEDGWTLTPGQSLTGAVTFQVPNGQSLHTVTFSPALFGGRSATWTLTA